MSQRGDVTQAALRSLRSLRDEPHIVDERGAIAAAADTDERDGMRTARKNGERGLIRAICVARRLILADDHAIDLHLHNLRSQLVIAALRRAQRQRIRTCTDVCALQRLTVALQKRHLHAFRRRRIAAGESASIAADAAAAVEYPYGPGRRIRVAADIRRLEAAVCKATHGVDDL